LHRPRYNIGRPITDRPLTSRRQSPNHGPVRQPVRVPGASGMPAILLATVRGRRATAHVGDYARRVVHQDHVLSHAGPAHMLRDGPAVHRQWLHQVIHRALEHVEFNVSTTYRLTLNTTTSTLLQDSDTPENPSVTTPPKINPPSSKSSPGGKIDRTERACTPVYI